MTENTLERNKLLFFVNFYGGPRLFFLDVCSSSIVDLIWVSVVSKYFKHMNIQRRVLKYFELRNYVVLSCTEHILSYYSILSTNSFFSFVLFYVFHDVLYSLHSKSKVFPSSFSNFVFYINFFIPCFWKV